jgi:hypothetical protein
MNSIMERWVGSVRRECLDRLLMTGEVHFPKVLSIVPIARETGSRHSRRWLPLSSTESG